MTTTELIQPPDAANAVIHLHASDNIAIARVPLAAGLTIEVSGRRILTEQAVPAGHKVAVAPIRAGEAVLRYGEVMGWAKTDIAAGAHVHVHNVAYDEAARGYQFPEEERPLAQPPENCPVFWGYPREDGRAGTRNYIAVVAASNCAAHTVQLAAESYRGAPLPDGVDGVVAFPHGEGCSHVPGPDLDQLERTIGGVIEHPNISGAVIIGLGCETNFVERYHSLGQAKSGRLATVTLQGSGGTRATVEQTRKILSQMIDRAAAERRVEVPAYKLVVGLQCGGSDSFSGITANPALGRCCDRLAEVGATFVLAETPEIFGAEHLLVKRARNRSTAERLLEMIEWYKAYLRQFGIGTFDDNPSPGNKAGGLTTILEKSLGAAAKAGSTVLNEVVNYGERVKGPGFVFMNTPGYDPISLAGLAAGGANLFAFTTGRGSVTGFPTVPVIKIASNTPMYRRMTDNMDVNAGRIADGTATVDEIGQEIFELALRVASGERTCAERFGHSEFVPWRIGPVM